MRYEIENDIWEIKEVTQQFVKRSVEVEETHFYIRKNGKYWQNHNGPSYESETEAEINILNEYRIK